MSSRREIIGKMVVLVVMVRQYTEGVRSWRGALPGACRGP